MSRYLRRTSWGYAIIENGKQVGAGVGLDPVKFHQLGKQQAWCMRTYGWCWLPNKEKR